MDVEKRLDIIGDDKEIQVAESVFMLSFGTGTDNSRGSNQRVGSYSVEDFVAQVYVHLCPHSVLSSFGASNIEFSCAAESAMPIFYTLKNDVLSP